MVPNISSGTPSSIQDALAPSLTIHPEIIDGKVITKKEIKKKGGEKNTDKVFNQTRRDQKKRL